jgi:hypothetical protein
VLEERRVLSTLIVTSSLDGGYPGGGTLRGEIAVAQSGDTIVFDPSLDGQTISLLDLQLEINKNLTIQGPGAGLLAISGDGRSRVFQVDAGANVTISGLTIERGNSLAATPYLAGDYTSPPTNGAGGGILNLGTLTLSGCTVTGNNTAASDGPWPYANWGGGIYNDGTLTLSGCTVTGNSAGVAGYSRYSKGGGIFNDTQGKLTILSSTVQNNTAADGADICNLGSMNVKNSSIGKVSHK